MFGRPARGPRGKPGESRWGLNLGSDSRNSKGADSHVLVEKRQDLVTDVRGKGEGV